MFVFLLVLLFLSSSLTDLKKNAHFTNISHNFFRISWNAPEKDNCLNIIWSRFSATCQNTEKTEAPFQCIICSYFPILFTNTKESNEFYDICRVSRYLMSYLGSFCLFTSDMYTRQRQQQKQHTLHYYSITAIYQIYVPNDCRTWWP